MTAGRDGRDKSQVCLQAGESAGWLVMKRGVVSLERRDSGGEEGVINVGDFIRKLSHLLKHLQDPMSEADLRQAGFLLRKIEMLAQVKEYGEIEITWL